MAFRFLDYYLLSMVSIDSENQRDGPAKDVMLLHAISGVSIRPYAIDPLSHLLRISLGIVLLLGELERMVINDCILPSTN